MFSVAAYLSNVHALVTVYYK